MSLFSQLNQIKDLKDQAKKLQNELANEVVDTESWGIKIKMNGNQEVLEVKIVDEKLLENKEKLEDRMKGAINESIKKVQQVMAKKMQSMGGLNLPGLN